MIKINKILLFLCLILIGCAEEGKELTFKILELKSAPCNHCASAEVHVQLIDSDTPKYVKINKDIEEKIISFLSEEDPNINSVQEGLDYFVEVAKEIQEDLQDEDTSQWNAAIDGDVNYDSEMYVTISLELYSFSGGAHGYNEDKLLTYDKKNGEMVKILDLIKDKNAFKELVEKMFREQEDIPAVGNINETGFMFPNDAFELAENIGFTEKGVILIYNQYEISSYADGKKTLVIPFEKAKDFLTF